jgi:hypothetical protein
MFQKLCEGCGKPVERLNRRGPRQDYCLNCRTKECAHCQRLFVRKIRTNKSRDANKFCSRACYFQSRKKNAEGKPKSTSSTYLGGVQIWELG